MAKHSHEVRDAVHVFDRLDSEERKVLDSRPFQRLRHIHQLAMTYLVYPGATHRRFEHSLGVMELAGRVFDTITADSNRHSAVRDVFRGPGQIPYWRTILRMAALCHDIGHLPFSHAAEKELLPGGMTHESITVELIKSDEMQAIWKNMEPPLDADDIAKLAVGPKEYKQGSFDNWERILSEIIVGDSFGVDRMDYLLRDSFHAGVVYGKFDHFRLIDTLRILPENVDSIVPALGIEAGGIQSAEALMLARYFMYSQVYFHPMRRAYDIHLKDFLISCYGKNGFPITSEEFLSVTDDEVLSDLRRAAKDKRHPGFDPAHRIMERKHFKLLYERNPNDSEKNPEAAKAIYKAAQNQFGLENIKFDSYRQKSSENEFPVRSRDERVVSSIAQSDALRNVPIVALDFVFVAPELRTEAQEWLKANLEKVISDIEPEEDEA